MKLGDRCEIKLSSLNDFKKVCEIDNKLSATKLVAIDR